MATQKIKKKKTLKRELLEWGFILLIFGLLYFTGLHTAVLGGIQSLVLKTGFIQPNLNPGKSLGDADYNFQFVDQAGYNVDLKSFQGKVILINFWATWCPPCVAEMPDLNNLYKTLDPGKFEFIMISVDDDFIKAKKFVMNKGYSFNIYRPLSDIPAIFSGNVIPTTYVIAPDGKIAVKREGMAQYNTKKFKKYLESL